MDVETPIAAVHRAKLVATARTLKSANDIYSAEHSILLIQRIDGFTCEDLQNVFERSYLALVSASDTVISLALYSAIASCMTNL